MNVSKIIKCVAHCTCAVTYSLFFLGFHAEALYLAPGAAYSLLTLADLFK